MLLSMPVSHYHDYHGAEECCRKHSVTTLPVRVSAR